MLRPHDAVALLLCTHCQVRRYLTSDALRDIEAVEKAIGKMAHTTGTTSVGVIVRHDVCNTTMLLCHFPSDMPPPMTIDDLKCVTIDETNAYDASDTVFQAWASQYFTMTAPAQRWTLEERVEFCDIVLIQNEYL